MDSSNASKEKSRAEDVTECIVVVGRLGPEAPSKGLSLQILLIYPDM